MGMYDTFRMPGILLPDMTYSEEGFQTKDLSCDLIEYFVTPDGRVMSRGYSGDLDDGEEAKWHASGLTGNVTLSGNTRTLQAYFFQGRLSKLELIE